MKIITREIINKIFPKLDLISSIEAGFDAYSSGRAVVPPVGELLMDSGEAHIKYGYIKDDAYYVIKVASGFYGNPAIGLPSGDGLMLLFSTQTGMLKGILLDGGCLTDARTAVAGAIAAKHLAASRVTRIGIVGTGTQAMLQLRYLKQVIPCRKVLAWGRGENQLQQYSDVMTSDGFTVDTTTNASDLMRTCNLIVTTTPATSPLLRAEDLQAGTHITAVGSDTTHKQELEAAIIGKADVVVADSIAQCRLRGEISKALQAGAITEKELIELGDVIGGRSTGRSSDEQITVADLTGVAVQDIKIATAVYEAADKSQKMT